MASSSYSPSDDEYHTQDASPPANPTRQRPGESPHQESRESHPTEFRPRQNDPARKRPLSQPRQLLDESNSVVQPRERQPSEGKSGQRKSRQEQSRQPKRLQSRSPQRRKEVKQNYRVLLNSVITEAVGRTGMLHPSQIGASFWTSHEKDCLFRRMCLTGRTDLPSLHRAVPTKSESEIKVYLQLLEHGRTTFNMVDAPAAVELSEECEDWLEASADSLATQINAHDASLQQAEFGENWLIDEESAYYIDLVFDQTPANDEEARGEESEHEDAKPSVSNQPPLIAESDASITLLRPSSFLQLSRTLFMNSSESADYNWQQADLIEKSTTSPAIFRGAFEDFHNLVISLTRRLVQVSLFQAMTRLRAGDASRHDWTPSPQVREVDVRLALDVLGMEPNAQEYWAKVVRRCKVDVLSESKKYMDGRQGSKTGVKLTYDEVEAELGLDKNQGKEIVEADSDDGTIDSDMFTETDTDEDVEIEEPTSKPPQERKRALSPSSYIKAEVKYLNAVDHNADVVEEGRLWKILRLDPPEHISLEEVKLPEHPGDGEAVADDWKDALQYETEWEHPLGCVENDDFVEMEKRGAQGRMRRRRAVDHWRRRTNGAESEEGDVDMESSGKDSSDDDDNVSSDHEMADEGHEQSDDGD